MKLFALVGLVMVIAVGVVRAASPDRQTPQRSLSPISNAEWRRHCGDCHVPYHPGLLPERSWNRLMETLDVHFGVNATPDPESLAEIRAFLSNNAADRSPNAISKAIAGSIAPSERPLRITATPWYRDTHRTVRAGADEHQCRNCHSGAADGRFSVDRS